MRPSVSIRAFAAYKFPVLELAIVKPIGSRTSKGLHPFACAFHMCEGKDKIDFVILFFH